MNTKLTPCSFCGVDIDTPPAHIVGFGRVWLPKGHTVQTFHDTATCVEAEEPLSARVP